MRSASALRTIGIVLTLLATVGTVLSQTPGDNPPGLEPGTDTPTVELDDEPSGLERLEEGADVEYILAQPPYTMNYQGYLTDGSGSPLDGTYDLEFRLYDDEIVGAVEWGPETHVDVPIASGIFQVALGTFVTLYPNDFDEALFLAVAVDGTVVTPRQPLRSVPYAFGLVPGAEVQGDPIASYYALSVENMGVDENDYGIYARGEKWGLYAEEVGADSNVGIYSPDFVHAQGFMSNDDTYLWVPGIAVMPYPASGCTFWPQTSGSVRLDCSSSGFKSVFIPITVPGVLFGQNVRVESILVFYDLDHAGSYITHTYLQKLIGAGSSQSLISDGTNRTSTSPTSYSLSASGNYTLTSSSGPLNLQLSVYHDGDPTHDVTVGGVRIRLGHTD